MLLKCRYFRKQNGCLVCASCGDTTTKPWPDEPALWPKKACGRPQVAMMNAVGLTLYSMLHELGAKPKNGCACAEMIDKMNRWGIDGCREHRSEIVEHLKNAYHEMSWPEWAEALAAATKTGLVLSIKPWDRFGSLLDEAIRRTESR